MTNVCGLDQLEFINRFVSQLPSDPEPDNLCRQVSGALYSHVRPTPVAAPRLVALAEDVATLIGLDTHGCDESRLANVLSGNELLTGMQPYASGYGGHQFGHWAGQLGDGRAINLGEVTGREGRGLTLQLKGAGPTPYSRRADGRAVLRSSVREFLCSEAMFHLGVPTTRALSLVTTGETVVRDMFYDGHPQREPGAIVCRVSPSFIRFGHFELLASRGENDLLETLLGFVIRTDWPDLGEVLDRAAPTQRKQIYLQWFERVCELTQQMVLHWQRVGFVHGVMNTDNMSVLGLTIDYGPYGWIDDYDPDWTPNTTDFEHRRYRFGQQAVIARWNLYQLANAIYPIIQDAEALQSILAVLPAAWDRMAEEMMLAKLGLPTDFAPGNVLLSGLEELLLCQPTDMTLFFRLLGKFDPTDPVNSLSGLMTDAFYDGALRVENAQHYQHWENQYRKLLTASAVPQQDRIRQMERVNPWFVPRNYIVQQVIEDLENGHRDELDRVMQLMRTPYATPTGQTGEISRYGGRRPESAKNKPGCSTLSCSS